MIKWQTWGSAPATTGYCAFAGAFGALVGLIGFGGIVIDALSGLIMSAVDGLASLLLLAGGIVSVPVTHQMYSMRGPLNYLQAMIVGLRGVSCTNLKTDWNNPIFLNPLLDGGIAKGHQGQEIGGIDRDHIGDYKGRCQKAEADAAFMFIAFAVSLGAALFCLVNAKRGGGRKAGYV